MPCKRWKDDWIAHLYGELSPPERSEVDEHLAACAECRATMDDLADSRRLLQASTPSVPAYPRVVVLRPRTGWKLAWAFAGGIAASALIFLAATFAASRGLAGSIGPAATGTPEAELAAVVQRLQDRMANLEQDPRSLPAGIDPTQTMTRAQFDREVEHLARRFNRQRAEDLDYLAQWLAASDRRTGSFMDHTQEALTYLALRGNPRLSEQ